MQKKNRYVPLQDYKNVTNIMITMANSILWGKKSSESYPTISQKLKLLKFIAWRNWPRNPMRHCQLGWKFYLGILKKSVYQALKCLTSISNSVNDSTKRYQNLETVTNFRFENLSWSWLTLRSIKKLSLVIVENDRGFSPRSSQVVNFSGFLVPLLTIYHCLVIF